MFAGINGNGMNTLNGMNGSIQQTAKLNGASPFRSTASPGSGICGSNVIGLLISLDVQSISNLAPALRSTTSPLAACRYGMILPAQPSAVNSPNSAAHCFSQAAVYFTAAKYCALNMLALTWRGHRSISLLGFPPHPFSCSIDQFLSQFSFHCFLRT